MLSIILQRNNSAKQEADDGHRFLSCFTQCQSHLLNLSENSDNFSPGFTGEQPDPKRF